MYKRNRMFKTDRLIKIGNIVVMCFDIVERFINDTSGLGRHYLGDYV